MLFNCSVAHSYNNILLEDQVDNGLAFFLLQAVNDSTAAVARLANPSRLSHLFIF